MRAFKIISFFLFLSFAAVQYNDIDPLLWIPIYLLAALICILSLYKKAPIVLIMVAMVLYAAGFIFYLPHFIDWFEKGMPSIIETMKAESPFIELIREALGLLICFLVMSIIYSSQRREGTVRQISKVTSK